MLPCRERRAKASLRMPQGESLRESRIREICMYGSTRAPGSTPGATLLDKKPRSHKRICFSFESIRVIRGQLLWVAGNSLPWEEIDHAGHQGG